MAPRLSCLLVLSDRFGHRMFVALGLHFSTMLEESERYRSVREQVYSAIIEAPFGVVGVRTDHGVLTRVDFLPGEAALLRPVDSFTKRIATALDRYLGDPRASLVVELALRGTPFQQRVWEALLELPVGATVSYGELAARLGTGARAVGGACRANPIPIFVPCHRVVAVNGQGGYAGDARGGWGRIKTWLLAHEAQTCRDATSVRPHPARGSVSRPETAMSGT
ncbi:MAG: methylated-DNA--[protein]-cysteine S-methyltransferase [Thiotrichales bacterium]